MAGHEAILFFATATLRISARPSIADRKAPYPDPRLSVKVEIVEFTPISKSFAQVDKQGNMRLPTAIFTISTGGIQPNAKSIAQANSMGNISGKVELTGSISCLAKDRPFPHQLRGDLARMGTWCCSGQKNTVWASVVFSGCSKTRGLNKLKATRLHLLFPLASHHQPQASPLSVSRKTRSTMHGKIVQVSALPGIA